MNIQYPEKIDVNILDNIRDRIFNLSEMSLVQQRFLNGVIRHIKPKKILEVGVAAGGSSLNDIFIQIKKLLTDNNLVLFSGCPCQVSALNHFLGKDYENLLTIDIFCNSIVPQKVWRKYLKETIKNDISNIEHIGFREKSKIGWSGGVYIRVNKYDYLPKDQYMMAFLQHISVKEECLYCKYRKFERTGDISIGDYWGVKEHDGKGVV